MMDGNAACARRIYEIHREQDIRRRQRENIPRWDELTPIARARRIAAFERLRRSYDAGRTQPREVRLS